MKQGVFCPAHSRMGSLYRQTYSIQKAAGTQAGPRHKGATAAVSGAVTITKPHTSHAGPTVDPVRADMLVPPWLISHWELC